MESTPVPSTSSRTTLIRTLVITVSVAVLVAGAFVAGQYFNMSSAERSQSAVSEGDLEGQDHAELVSAVLPEEGYTLPVIWGELGVELVESGVIDADKFQSIYESRGEFTDQYDRLLSGKTTDRLVITKDNANFLLNMFWALGLASKNPILNDGEMQDPRYGGAGRFASTGGWTLAVGGPMEHYSAHFFFDLTSAQQGRVEKVSKGIYRPCCGNSTHFPDCNHGMAMLGLLELMASQGASEEVMWDAALKVNSYWFPQTYTTMAQYFEQNGTVWSDVDPKVALSSAYSSSAGYQRIQQAVEPSGGSPGSSCAV